MFWLDRIYGQIQEAIPKKLAANKSLLIRDEKTLSGRVHVGSMRALALHAAIHERLTEAGVPSVFKYEINDFDPMDGLPVYLDEATYKPHMGKPLYTIPSPEPSAKNFAEYFASEYIEAIHTAGFEPEFYRASELYLSGKMNEAIRLALDGAAKVRAILFEVSGAKRPDDWYPLQVICESCGKLSTTKVNGWDGTVVTYTCYKTAVDWTEGCDHSGTVSPFDGRAKLMWKVDWPAKWFVNGVDIEGGGKDHYTKGGSRDVGRRVTEEIFKYPEPFGVPNEFFLVGGKKMSSSKGEGSSAKEIVSLIPPHIFRLALFGKEINQQINFDPSGDTIPVLYDQYDKLAEKFWNGVEDDDTRLFVYLKSNQVKRFLPRFSQLAFIVQMPHLDLYSEVERLKGAPLTDEDKREADERAKYAKHWLSSYAPEEFVFALQESVPDAARSLSAPQKAALKAIATFISNQKVLDGLTLQTELHEIRKRSGLEPKELFGAVYLSFLGKDHGPKIGWFLSVLDKSFVEKRLTEVSRE